MNIGTLLNKYFSDNKAALANAAGVTRQAVSQWDIDETVKAEYVLTICGFLDWRVSPHVLRPDLYPNASDAMPCGSAVVTADPVTEDRRIQDQRGTERRGVPENDNVEKAA